MRINPRKLFAQVASCIPRGNSYKALLKSGEEEHRFTVEEGSKQIHVTVWISTNSEGETVKIETVSDAVEAVSEWNLAQKCTNVAWVIKQGKFTIICDDKEESIDPLSF